MDLSANSPSGTSSSEGASHDGEGWRSLVGVVLRGFLWLGAGWFVLYLPAAVAAAAVLALIAAFLRIDSQRRATLLGGPLPGAPAPALPWPTIAPWLAVATTLLVLAATLHARLWVSLWPDLVPAASRLWQRGREPYFFWPVLLSASVLTPLVEEWIFRGRLQPALIRRWGVVPGILVTSLLFAALHGTLIHLSLSLMTGIVMGTAVHLTGRLLAAVVIHAARNAVSIVDFAVATPGASPTPLAGPSLLISAAVLLATVTLLFVIGVRVARLRRRHAVAASLELPG